MTSRAGGVVAIAIVVAGLPLAALTLRARDTAYTLPGAAEQLMYLRSGQVASRLMLSFKAIASDVYWIRAIQHYGNERKTSSRFALLQPLLDLTTTLDPHFNIAYRFGAIFLSLEPPNGPARRDQAVALLEKGLANNPTRWQYAHDIAFIEYLVHRRQGRGRAVVREGRGDARCTGVDSPARSDDAPRGRRPPGRADDAERTARVGGALRSGRGRAGVAPAQRARPDRRAEPAHRRILRAHARVSREPRRADARVRVQRAAADPTGTPYAYDPATHVASLSPASALNPLPKTLPKK